MSNALPIEDLSKTYLEHSMVINNFVIKIGSQIKDSLEQRLYHHFHAIHTEHHHQRHDISCL